MQTFTVALWIFGIAVSGILGCGGDVAGPSIRKDVMWSLSVGPPGVSLAVDETYQLRVQPLDYHRELIENDVAVTYRSYDTQTVVVDTTGLVRAVRPSNGVGKGIGITVRAGQVTKNADVLFGVTESAVDVDSISLVPAVGEPVLPLGASTVVRARTFNSAGVEVPNIFSFTKAVAKDGVFLDLGSFFSGSGILQPMVPWTGWIHASVWVNGRLLTDSLQYRVGYRPSTNVTVAADANGDLTTTFSGLQTYKTNIYIMPNGKATFINNLTTPINVTFESPNNVKSSVTGDVGGNIVELPPRGRVVRWFPTVGDYFFTVHSGARSKRVSITVKE